MYNICFQRNAKLLLLIIWIIKFYNFSRKFFCNDDYGVWLSNSFSYPHYSDDHDTLYMMAIFLIYLIVKNNNMFEWLPRDYDYDKKNLNEGFYFHSMFIKITNQKSTSTFTQSWKKEKIRRTLVCSNLKFELV